MVLSGECGEGVPGGFLDWGKGAPFRGKLSDKGALNGLKLGTGIHRHGEDLNVHAGLIRGKNEASELSAEPGKGGGEQYFCHFGVGRRRPGFLAGAGVRPRGD